MFKKIITIILIIAFSLIMEGAYNSNRYMKVVDVQGNVKLEVDVKGYPQVQASKKMIQKPARLGDLLFTRDTIITGTSSLTAYLQNRILLKVKENSSLYLDSTFDKNGNIIFSLRRGEILIVSPMSYKPDYITVYTPDNSTINISGTAIVSHNGGTTRVQFLHGYGKLNNTPVGQFTEVNLRDRTTTDIVMDASLRNRVNEILGMQYIDKVTQVNIYRDIAKLNNSTTFNVKQIIAPPELEFER
ncbi:FecR domain-containing protein [Brachyspira catarrhinii]|uniref:FecR protein domain-containing protein n=1 Tax=Brachyspira catarrhinii TaxID=2528966 RepID=A0ABY2TT45_9SPIR|nr:FecR domain-containing protein [Brachyspira catarrhinii]TKZ36047.1 hypothetical protein EZH24_02070 [Brachyspira catarrhinii]